MAVESSESQPDRVNEQSPLLPPSEVSEDGRPNINKAIPTLNDEEGDGEEDVWMGEEQENRSSWYMFLLTLGGFGLQMGWSVEMSNGSPYLLSLGLNKALLALVWIAGPLSGVIVQPYVGLTSDRSRSKWGKRRPYIIGGGLATIFSLMMLAWIKEIVGWFFGLFGASPTSDFVTVIIMIFAVFFVYMLDFAINVIQAALRAFAVDLTPIHQQESANAWISRMSGIGNIFGMFCGGINLPKTVPWLGNSQFKVLCAIASISMLVTAGISCAAVSERDPRHDNPPKNSSDSVLDLFRSLWKSVFRMPKQVASVCRVQILAWMGWFPFLFYTTTYVGEIYVDPYLRENPNMSKEEVDELWEAGTRRGTVALLAFAIVTFIASVILPFFVEPTYKSPSTATLESSASTYMAQSQPELMTSTPASSLHRQRRMSASRSNTFLTKSLRTFNKLRSVSVSILSNIQIPGLTLRRTWLYSHILFCICMWATLFVRSVPLATVLVGLVGLPWAVAMWAPFALISAEISKREILRRKGLRIPSNVVAVSTTMAEDAAVITVEDGNEDGVEVSDQAGVVLGIHNCAISAPQVIMTIAGSLLFKWLQKPRGTPGDESVAWFFRLGGLCALAAAWFTMQVTEDADVNDGNHSTRGLSAERYDEERLLGENLDR